MMFKFLLILLFNLFLFSGSIDLLLDKIKVEDDLSKKTKKENGGILDLLTRDDLEKLQIHNFKDLLKYLTSFNYRTNSFGIYDPLNTNQFIFSSDAIKIFIDNQEITNSFIGSGIFVYESLDLDFVDHVEFYSLNPTFEYSTEPAVVLIKIYSKKASRDSGKKIKVSVDNLSGNSMSFHSGDELNNNYSYFAYVSSTNYKEEKDYIQQKVLSKDKKINHIFATYYNDSNHFLIDYVDLKRDAFIGKSYFLTSDKNDQNDNYLHVGFSKKINYNLSYQLNFDKNRIKYDFYDENSKQQVDIAKQLINSGITNENLLILSSLPYSVYSDISSNTFTAGMKYKKNMGKNNILLGIKIRDKKYEYNKKEINEQDKTNDRLNKEQVVCTVFVENRYSFRNDFIFTSGGMVTKSDYKNSIQSNDLIGIRFGLTKTTKNWTFKTVASKIEKDTPPYMIDNEIIKDIHKKLKKTNRKYFIQDVKFEENSNIVNGRFIYLKSSNDLVADESGKIDNYNKNVLSKASILVYEKKYNYIDKFYMLYIYSDNKNIPYVNSIVVEKLLLKNVNVLGKIDIFNSLIYYSTNKDNNSHYNYDAGIRYHYNKDLIFSLKGENIFNNSNSRDYLYFDTNTNDIKTFETQYFSKKFIATIEWAF